LARSDSFVGSKAISGEYPPIADHGLIGDLRTAALVGADGTINWYCTPRFDSPSVFAAILDHSDGGHFLLGPTLWARSSQFYFPDTNVLITRFFTPGGVGEVQDFMPISLDPGEIARHRLIRRVLCARGSMRFDLECAPRFDYAREEHELHIDDPKMAVFEGSSLTLALSATVPMNRAKNDVGGSFTLEEGETATFELEVLADGARPSPCSNERAAELFTETVEFWRRWLSQSRYRGRWRETVNRSALALKLMTYAPTGALIAAPTTSLPEQLGGERNWDYRFTWIRDAAFSVYALLRLGFTEEAQAFGTWLGDRFDERRGHAGGPLQIMYAIDGTAEIPEQELTHLEGYAGSAPVRIGNGAADQLQLDIYGEMLDSVYLFNRHARPISARAWDEIARVVDWLCENWDQADEGIWETRGGRKDFTYSRLMSWVGLDRAVRISRDRGLPADIQRWTRERDTIYRQIMERGWSEKRNAFIQHYDDDVLDASLLMMPLTKFIAPADPKWLSTLEAMGQDLVSDSLVYRYDPEASPDGLRGDEGTFSICSFWYVEALTRAGYVEAARLAFEKMLTYSNHLGLFSEEIGPTGEQLGNFPQAFTHLALISAAYNLDRALG
jgi:GH15 family glucan-1,4-alpha-glucosidase